MNLRREKIIKEFEKMFEKEELIRGWRSELVIENKTKKKHFVHLTIR